MDAPAWTVVVHVIRIVVTHHPFDLPGPDTEDDVIGRASMAIQGFARCRVDMILSGHLHFSHASPTPVCYGDTGYTALLVQAGTATSSRRREELNSFNLIRIDRPLSGRRAAFLGRPTARLYRDQHR